MIHIKKLTKTYGSKTILKDFQYTFYNHQIYGLIGRNGIGKTTFMKCMCGLECPDAIQIETEEGDVSLRDYLDRDIYYVSDEPVYYNDLTMREHLWLICKVEGYKKEEAKKAIHALTEQYQMEEYMDFYPSAMSKGTLQRMMLITAFLRKTKNILLDEPFNGLDPIQLKHSLEICEKYRHNRCIIISSHDLESLEEICDRCLVFTKDGLKEVANVERESINQMIGESYE
ncbi:ABC-2 type transport system ATP-binding protein [Lachnospiraceae bacterium A10]|nr:ABC-2 type transport system ATP-binding protein [Lachnospiraceae bacterium A10]